MTTETAPAQAATTKATNHHPELICRVKAAGLLDRRPLYYTVKITGTVLVFAAGWAALFLVGASWWSLLVAAFLAAMSTQVAFIGHDAGHRQVFGSKMANTRLGFLLGNLLVGLSIGYWVRKHNEHHAFPNTEGLDPDIATGALVHTADEAAARGRFGRFLSRNQAYLFFPMLTLEGFNLHASSFRAMFGNTVTSRRMRAQESALLLLHVSLYLAAVFYVLTPVQALAFIGVHQGLWGFYMGISFAPNHKGMPILKPSNKLGYVEKQVMTARNIRGGRIIDLLLGGLNYQAEHHLFPNMPRPGLRRLQPIVRAFCAEHDILYTEVTFGRSFYEVLRHLKDVGANA